MKKNFFKKLSFVLVLAMVLSVFAPVGSAFAAKAPKLNTSKKYLLLDNEDRNEYDFNVSNVAKGATVRWLVGNEAVATVDKNGVVTAKGPGVTNVAAEVTPKGGKAVRARAKVVVYDNAVEVEVTDLPEADVKVGEEHDFDKAYVTEAGSTSKTSSKFKWSVEKDGEAVSEDVATIDLKGIFVAKEAGEYTIVVRAFQSNPKYKAWVNNNELDYVTATAETTVKVAADIETVKQVDSTKFEVTFNGDMSKTDVTKVASIFKIVADKEVSTGTEKVKEIKLDETGKVATVTMYSKFAEGSTYRFKFDGAEGEFVAAKVDPKEIAEIKYTEDPVKATVNEKVELVTKVQALNADGVVIYEGKDLGTDLSFAYDDGNKYKGYASSNGDTYMYEAGAEATVTAKYFKQVYNKDTQKYDDIKHEATVTVVGVNLDKSILAGSMSHQLTNGDVDAQKDDNWARSFRVAQGENLAIKTRYKTANVADKYTPAENEFTYESSSTDVVIVYGKTLYFASKGQAVILVRDADKNVVDSFDVTVTDSRHLVSVNPDESATTVSIGNIGTDAAETKEFKFLAKDNLDKGIINVVVSDISEPKTKPAGDNVVAPKLTAANSDKDGKITIKVTAAGANPGLYVYEAKFTLNDKEFKHVVSVNVIDATTDTKAVRWELEYDKEVDLKDKLETKVKVFGFNAAGARVVKLDQTKENYKYKLEVSGKDADVINGTTVLADKLGVGTYNVVATVVEETRVDNKNTHISGREDKAALMSGVLVVKDSTKKEVSVKEVEVSATNVATAINAAFTFKLNDEDVTFGLVSGDVATINGKTVSGSATFATDLKGPGHYFVEKVIINGVTFDVNKGIKVK